MVPVRTGVGATLRLALALLAMVPARAGAQEDAGRTGPRFQLRTPQTELGPAPGTAEAVVPNLAPPDSLRGMPLSGRGRGPRLPTSVLRAPGAVGTPRPAQPLLPEPTPPTPEAPRYGTLAVPEREDEGPADGLTLDAALDRLLRHNRELQTLAYAIPQAQADVLTAGLRINPLLYFDAAQVPYGKFSPERPGGSTQYDLTVTIPVDPSRKRAARVAAACAARRVVEAQYQDAVRTRIGELYAAYVDAMELRETVRFAEAGLAGLQDVLEATRRAREAGQKNDADVQLIAVQSQAARIALRDARGRLAQAHEAIGAILALSPEETAALRLRGTLQPPAPPLPLAEELTRIARAARPDLAAMRLGIARAEADYGVARAERIPDVYVTYAPYTFQNNEPYGLKSAHSWTLALTVPVPIFNRNQGNIRRARLTAAQARVALEALQRQVDAEVRRAALELDGSRDDLQAIERDLLPGARAILADRYARYQQGDLDVADYLDAGRAYNDVVRQYRDAALRYRRAMLELNTAAGVRLLP